MKKTVLMAYLLAVSLPAVTAPEIGQRQLEQAAIAHEQRDYTREVAILLPLAERGNATAQYKIGVLYFDGHGVEKDYTRAHSWFEKAAIQGNALAQYNLGVLYESGWGVAQDYTRARYWYGKAASQGYTAAQTALRQLQQIQR